MPYNYEERMNLLNEINKIADIAERIINLEAFITLEQVMLSKLFPPTNRSQALDLAIRQLQRLQEQEQQEQEQQYQAGPGAGAAR